MVYQMRLFLSLLLAASNLWATENKRSPSLNWLPGVRCKLPQSVPVTPNSRVLVREVQIFTLRRGTGCKAEEKPSFWKKCDLRKNEEDGGSDPETHVVLWLTNPDTYRKGDILSFTMEKDVERRAFVDRKGHYLGYYETTARENVDFTESEKYHIIAKRQIPKAEENKIVAEIQFYQPGSKEKGLRSKRLKTVKCEAEFNDRSY